MKYLTAFNEDFNTDHTELTSCLLSLKKYLLSNKKNIINIRANIHLMWLSIAFNEIN